MVSFKDEFARLLVRKQVEQDLSRVNKSDLSPDFVDLSAKPTPDGFPARAAPPANPIDPKKLNICIVGAGVAGLYTSMILTRFGIPHDLLEASDRVGGRIKTHYFSKEPHDYYDIGAMRFPDTAVMKRTFDLFDTLGIPRVPYIMSGNKNPLRYNDITVYDYNKNKAREDPFKVSVRNKGPVPDQTVKDPDSILNDAYDWYRLKIKRDPARGFQYLFNHDRFSLRDYLQFVENQDPETIDWIETMNSGTNWFDQALTENILEGLDFDYGHSEIEGEKDTEVEWKCVEGGSEVLTQAMYRHMKDNGQLVEFDTEVTGMTYDNKTERITVNLRKPDGEAKEPRTYDTVFNTTTFSAMQKMDLTGLNLPYASKAALRSLRYETSTKVGIKFKKMWWRDDFGINNAGLGKTDMPLRTCVYPSYNINDEDSKSYVLLASYTWGADSERIAALVKENSPASEGPLKDLMLDDLARLHTTNDDDYAALREKLYELYDGHHAYDWSKDRWTSGGAFALFGPGQFTKLYSSLTKPMVDGKLHVIGEAASAHHAWVVGALDSAIRGVHLFLERFHQKGLQDKLQKIYNPTGEMDYDTDYLQVALGMLPPGQQPKQSDTVTDNLSKEMRQEVKSNGVDGESYSNGSLKRVAVTESPKAGRPAKKKGKY